MREDHRYHLPRLWINAQQRTPNGVYGFDQVKCCPLAWCHDDHLGCMGIRYDRCFLPCFSLRQIAAGQQIINADFHYTGQRFDVPRSGVALGLKVLNVLTARSNLAGHTGGIPPLGLAEVFCLFAYCFHRKPFCIACLQYCLHLYCKLICKRCKKCKINPESN